MLIFMASFIVILFIVVDFFLLIKKKGEGSEKIWAYAYGSKLISPTYLGHFCRENEGSPTLNHTHEKVPSIFFQINKETRSCILTDLVGGCTVKGIDRRRICKPPVERETDITK